jgi:hypothetical protein
MKALKAGRGWCLAALISGLTLGGLGSSLAVTPVDGRGLMQPAPGKAAQTVEVTAPGFMVAPAEVRARWTEGCLRNPEAAERLRQLHLNSVRPLALALGGSVEARYPAPAWAVCQ